MKTKFISILIFSVFIAQVFTSCKKDFLDKEPLDKLSSSTFWKSEADVQMALSGVYARLQSGFYSQYKVWLDAYSDNAWDRFDYFGFKATTQGIINPTSVNTTFYNTPYRGISACNYFLDNIGKAPISDAAKNSYSAEVKFLRGMYYFDLVQSFGGVVLYKTSPPDVASSKIAQSSKEDVLAFVKEDLDFAIANLPDQPYNGHVVKGSALAVRARVALYEKNWQKAVDLTSQIMNSGKFSIAQDYSGLFQTATQQGNPEIMFSTKYLAPNNNQGGYAGFDIEVGWWGAVQPYQNLVDEYEMTNGKMITDPTSGYNPSSPYTNRDPRLQMSIELPIDPTYPNSAHDNNTTETGYRMKKYTNPSNFSYTKMQNTDQNVVYIRYAEVLLMYAEAKNELSGPDASIYTALNQIRQRASVNLPPVNVIVNNTQSSLRDFIRHERRVELALEGHRYYDLKRWNLMDAKLSALKNPGGVQMKFGEKNNVLPFPQSELDKNFKLKQNTGY
ncbi:RagB/SusD family nutrient uptake outer membrane protein [Chitinophagaceae bacterium LB-8]|uniref:RagB/SusD family nutrient uptake outer membrane protein n=1 Tax=Paraflavisolibacter caeni TaxID=2982496 RepID=A0A9X2XXH0_9BACT|nr:RagB/SusD family nutrient uptake outer membrane protein [Paraflavisolibacter caeni]MCU7550482.1 RagB/SusD family nutrient uptake outer membrane protein [Paraflavisolibacter caeni]